MKKRLKALKAKVAQEGLILTESQLAALEKAKAEKEAHGEFESECPGMRGSRHLLRRQHEGRRAHLPADVHRYLRQGRFRQAHDRKTPITAADLLNDRVVPFYDASEVRLCRVLTDRGTEYAATPSITNTSSIWRSKISTIRAPRPRARKRMASSSGSTRRCSMSSIASSSARRSIDRSPNFRPTSMPGSKVTMRTGRIKGDGLRQDADADLP